MQLTLCPDGRQWTVRRTWRIRAPQGDFIRPALNIGAALIVAVLLVVLGVPVILPVLFLITGVLYWLSTRPWIIEAKTYKSDPRERHRWIIRGWRNSDEFMQFVRDELEAGRSQIHPPHRFL